MINDLGSDDLSLKQLLIIEEKGIFHFSTNWIASKEFQSSLL